VAINDRGQVLGSYRTHAGSMGFIYDNGHYTTIAAPNASDTIATALNDLGAVVGTYTSDSSEHGFVDINGRLSNVDVPGASQTRPLRSITLAKSLVFIPIAPAATVFSRHPRVWAPDR
jgi:hypothetical protein